MQQYDSYQQEESVRAVTHICYIAIFAITPFAIVQALGRDWSVLLVDLCMILSMAIVLLLLRKRVAVNIVIHIVSLSCTFGVATIIYESGFHTIYWIYAVAIVNFYTLPPIKAAFLNTVLIVLVFPALTALPDNLGMARVLMSFLMVNFFSFSFSSNMHNQRRQLAELATIDSLTGVRNRRNLMDQLNDAVLQYKRWQMPTSLIIFDVDLFKRINDTYGHIYGDQVLIDVAKIVQNRIRSTDRLFRYGGEEFVVLMLNTGLNDTVVVAEDLRKAISSASFLEDENLTISIGASQLRNGETIDAWLDRTDSALYSAKNSGRNRVVVSDAASKQASVPCATLVASE